MTLGRPLLRLLLAGALIAWAAASATAQTYPTKPIKLVLPYAPGGIIDYVGRTLAQKLTEVAGQPVVAENRPGAGGIVGTDTVARSAPDGYTLVLMDPAIVINPTLQADIPYDVFKTLQTVSIVCTSPEVLVVSPKLPVSTFSELVAYATPIPASLTSHRPASARRPISPAKCSSCAPASMPRTFPIRASARHIPT